MTDNTMRNKKMRLVAKFASDTYDEIYVIASEEGSYEDLQQQLKRFKKSDKHLGWMIDLEDEEGDVYDTAVVERSTIEEYFKVKTKSEAAMWQEGQDKFINMLINMGLDPNEEHEKITQSMQ